jgi:hypothetical protein
MGRSRVGVLWGLEGPSTRKGRAWGLGSCRCVGGFRGGGGEGKVRGRFRRLVREACW